jgi:hypothetical protein
LYNRPEVAAVPGTNRYLGTQYRPTTTTNNNNNNNNKMSAIRYTKNLSKEDYTRYDQIRSDRNRDNPKWDDQNRSKRRTDRSHRVA